LFRALQENGRNSEKFGKSEWRKESTDVSQELFRKHWLTNLTCSISTSQSKKPSDPQTCHSEFLEKTESTTRRKAAQPGTTTWWKFSRHSRQVSEELSGLLALDLSSRDTHPKIPKMWKRWMVDFDTSNQKLGRWMETMVHGSGLFWQLEWNVGIEA